MSHIATTVRDDLALAQGGDRPAFGRLVTACHGAALALAGRITGNPDDAEDAVQEALLKTWHSLADLRDGRGFRAWFLRIVYNQCLDARRRRETRARYERAVPARSAEGALERAAAAELMARVAAAIEQLPPRQAAALHLRVTEQMPYEELAGVLGLTPQSARVIVTRARRRLRELLGPDLDTP